MEPIRKKHAEMVEKKCRDTVLIKLLEPIVRYDQYKIEGSCGPADLLDYIPWAAKFLLRMLGADMGAADVDILRRDNFDVLLKNIIHKLWGILTGAEKPSLQPTSSEFQRGANLAAIKFGLIPDPDTHTVPDSANLLSSIANEWMSGL